MNFVTRGRRAIAGMVFAAALAIPTAAFATTCIKTTTITTYTVFGYVVYQTTEVTTTCYPD